VAYRKVDHRELAGTSNRPARGVGVGDHVGVYAKNSVEHVVALYDAFTCGPAPFMTLMNGALRELGFPRERRHQERFVSLGGNPFGDVDDVARPARRCSSTLSRRASTHPSRAARATAAHVPAECWRAR
jgi:ferredoxin-NADP reductase